MRLLVLTVCYTNDVAYYSDWADAFVNHPGVSTVVQDIGTNVGKRRVRHLMRETDAIVALHATTADWLVDLVELTSVLLDRRVPLVIFIGNEFNQPFPWIADKIAAVKNVHAEIVVSQLLQETAEWLYSDTGARILSLPHALNPRRFFPGPSRVERRLDLASRSFPYPIYVGDHERNGLFAAATRLTMTSRFATDVRVDSRLDPDAWARLLRATRATLSTEAGIWYLERDDHTARRVEQILRRTGRAGFGLPPALRRTLRGLPSGVKDVLRRAGRKLPLTYAPLATPDPTTLAEIDVLFSQSPRSPVYGKCISARHLDALGTMTVQLLTPGRYNDILKPGEHYLEVAADGSDLDEVLEIALEPKTWTRITEAGLALGKDSTYFSRVKQLLGELSRLSA